MDPELLAFLMQLIGKKRRPGLNAFGDAPPGGEMVRDAEPLLNAFHNTSALGPGHPQYQPGTAGHINPQRGDRWPTEAEHLQGMGIDPSLDPKMVSLLIDVLNWAGRQETRQQHLGEFPTPFLQERVSQQYGGKRGPRPY